MSPLRVQVSYMCLLNLFESLELAAITSFESRKKNWYGSQNIVVAETHVTPDDKGMVMNQMKCFNVRQEGSILLE